MSLYPDSWRCTVCDRIDNGRHWNENSRCKCHDPVTSADPQSLPRSGLPREPNRPEPLD